MELLLCKPDKWLLSVTDPLPIEDADEDKDAVFLEAAEWEEASDELD